MNDQTSRKKNQQQNQQALCQKQHFDIQNNILSVEKLKKNSALKYNNIS